MSIINGAGLNSFRSQFTAGTTYALAEVIDNSIQWKRKKQSAQITIVFIEHKPGWHVKDVLIFDNGVGMDQETISTCLDFGGGKNHGTTDNGKLGKFGLGLPYSSCSQSPNYHVYSWQSKNKYFHNYRNHKEYEPNDPVESNEVQTLSQLPSEIIQAFPQITTYESGTVVHWKECDRLDVVKAKTLIKHIELNLGRIYRHYLNAGEVEINFIVYRHLGDKLQKIHDLSQPIRVFDPLFLMKNTCLPGENKNESTNDPWGGVDGKGEESIPFEEIKNGETIIHNIKIRYSIAKPEIQSLGGGSDLGKYYKRATGISLVRANRELKLDHFDFKMRNSSDARHRWWSVEVLFEPISDELFGVNANKLDARNFRYISSEDIHELEADGELDAKTRLRGELSKKIQTSIDAMFKIITARGKGANSKQICPSCKQKTFIKGKCDNCNYSSKNCPIHNIKLDSDGMCQTCKSFRQVDMCVIHKVHLNEDGKCPRCPNVKKSLTIAEKKELKNILNQYPEFEGKEEEIDRTISWFLKSNKDHFFVLTDLKNPSTFINYRGFQDGKFVIIEINTCHPFYEQFMHEIIEEDEESSVTPLLLFIGSWINTEKDDYSNNRILERFRVKFGSNLMDIIANWIHD